MIYLPVMHRAPVRLMSFSICEGLGEGEIRGVMSLDGREGDSPGEGGTDSLSLSTNCETTAPRFGQSTAPVLLPPNLQPPLFMDNQAQPLEISIKWCIFCITYIIFYQIKVSRTNLNAYNCYLMWNIGCKYSDSPPIIQYDKRTAPSF